MFKPMENMIKMLSPDFKLTKRPSEGPFTIAGQAISAGGRHDWWPLVLTRSRMNVVRVPYVIFENNNNLPLYTKSSLVLSRTRYSAF